jgi:hypothetical protein
MAKFTNTAVGSFTVVDLFNNISPTMVTLCWIRSITVIMEKDNWQQSNEEKFTSHNVKMVLVLNVM